MFFRKLSSIGLSVVLVSVEEADGAAQNKRCFVASSKNVWSSSATRNPGFAFVRSCVQLISFSPSTEITLFGNITKEYTCEGCKTGNNKKHNGIYCKIMNWDTNRKIKFETLLKKK